MERGHRRHARAPVTLCQFVPTMGNRLFGGRNSFKSSFKMLRRFATLCVLLLSLSGAIPVAVACAFSTQSSDCCPSGQRCPTEGASAVMVPADSLCCIAQSAPTRATVAVNGQSDRRFADSPLPDDAAAPASAMLSSFSSLHERTALAVLPPVIAQQQVYLHTGRLRL